MRLHSLNFLKGFFILFLHCVSLKHINLGNVFASPTTLRSSSVWTVDDNNSCPISICVFMTYAIKLYNLPFLSTNPCHFPWEYSHGLEMASCIGSKKLKVYHPSTSFHYLEYWNIVFPQRNKLGTYAICISNCFEGLSSSWKVSCKIWGISS